MLNIVENAISTFKAALKRDLEAERPAMLEKTHQDQMIQLAIMSKAALQSIRPEMGQSWFRHLQSYLPSCHLFRDILM